MTLAADGLPALDLDRLDAVLFDLTRLPLSCMHRLRSAGVLVGIVATEWDAAASPANSGVNGLVDVVLDDVTAKAMRLAEPPDPARYLEVAARLGVDLDRTAVIGGAATVTAGRVGGFGVVVAVDQHPDLAPLAAGFNLVVSDADRLQLRGAGPLADGWHLTYRPTNTAAPSGPVGEGMRETLCTLANGYVGTRGAATWATDDGIHYPGCYLAGVYNRLETWLGPERTERENIVKAPNWLPLSFSVQGGPWLGEPGATVTDDELRLDLHAGVLRRRYRVIDAAGRRTAVTERRLVSMADPHLAGIQLDLVAENWAGDLRIRSGIDGDGCAEQTAEARRLAHCHLRLSGRGEDEGAVIWLAARTTRSDVVIAQAARTRISGAAGPPEMQLGSHDNGRDIGQDISHEYSVGMGKGVRCRVEKIVAIHTSRDRAISEPIGAARQAALQAPGFLRLLANHRTVWERLWAQARIETLAADRTAGMINLHLFHLLQVAPPHVAELDVGLGARGLHGEGYAGHVFWDELFAFPFLNLHFPRTSRALLRYRQRRLPAARRLARVTGGTGARFPWQSGSDGRDETPTMLFNPRSSRWMPDRSAQQRHVGLAVAYNYWQHWQTTGDDAFFLEDGADVLVEVARHFAHLASFDDELGRFRILGVMGPDEFHDGYPWTAAAGIDDNSYTNVLTAWLLHRVLELADLLHRDRRGDVLDRLGLDRTELGYFDAVSRGLYVPFHDGIISQFDRYERLAPIDLHHYLGQYGNIGRLDLILDAEGDTVRRYQVAKQADTLMLCYLLSPGEMHQTFARLGYELSDDVIRKTIDYYAARAVHGSTLSQVVHAWVTARADRSASWQHLTEALAADMADTQGGTTAEGIHLGAMAGTIDLFQRCYPGLETRDGVLALDPVLPDEIDQIGFGITYRGHRLNICINHERVTVGSAPGHAAPVTVQLAKSPALLRPGSTISTPIAGNAGKRHTTGPRKPAGAPATDPVCGMVIDQAAAAATSHHLDDTFYFCSRSCQQRFAATPERFLPIDL